MIRLLILLGIVYFGYKKLKSLMIQYTSAASAQPRSEIDDVMVKDPFCGVFFPKREGLHLNIDGEDLFFCSLECKDKYIASRSK